MSPEPTTPNASPEMQPSDDELLETYHGVPWLVRDARQAESEGWALFESDRRGVEVERDDESEQLPSDEAALHLVTEQARAGSSTHLKALLITSSSWYHRLRFPSLFG